MARHKIENLYAFVVDDPNDGEGVLTKDTPSGRIPMIGKTRDQLELYRNEAIEIATGLQMPLVTATFIRAHTEDTQRRTN